jgi:hypothetical protein
VATAAKARRSAQRTAGKTKAKAKVKPRKQASKPAAKKGSKAPLAAVLTTPAAQLKAPAEPQFTLHDFRMSIDDMEPARLRAYARHIGIVKRDIDGLTEQRLRQNCKARVALMHED